MSTVTKYVPADGYTVSPALISPADSRSRFSRSSSPRALIRSSGNRRPTAIAGWNGPPFTYVRNCFAVRIARTSGGDAQTHPIFHPVHENDLPPDEIVT